MANWDPQMLRKVEYLGSILYPTLGEVVWRKCTYQWKSILRNTQYLVLHKGMCVALYRSIAWIVDQRVTSWHRCNGASIKETRFRILEGSSMPKTFVMSPIFDRLGPSMVYKICSSSWIFWLTSSIIHNFRIFPAKFWYLKSTWDYSDATSMRFWDAWG